jgi:hypothetical protein
MSSVEITDRYLDTLLLYYEEEIAGEAYFRAMAAKFTVSDQRDKMILLAEVEAHAAKGVAPLLEKYALVPRNVEELRRLGQGEAEADTNSYAESLVQMQQTYPGYVDDFLALEALGPAEDRERLAFLTGHEYAALEFLALEARGVADSVAPLRAYLASDPERLAEPWVR